MTCCRNTPASVATDGIVFLVLTSPVARQGGQPEVLAGPRSGR